MLRIGCCTDSNGEGWFCGTTSSWGLSVYTWIDSAFSRVIFVVSPRDRKKALIRKSTMIFLVEVGKTGFNEMESSCMLKVSLQAGLKSVVCGTSSLWIDCKLLRVVGQKWTLKNRMSKSKKKTKFVKYQERNVMV